MIENSNPLLTIIVPAYNVDKYITDCLDSLVKQTKQNHKIVIINDGSIDYTEKICLDYQTRYSNLITYIYQENQGLGAARNVGLKIVDTPYLCFLDSDDWLNIRYVECFSQLLEEVDELPDMVFTLPWVYDSITNRVTSWKDKEKYDRIFEVHDGVSRIQTNARQSPELYALEVTACRKIYKTSFLKKNKFSFPEQIKWEDVPGHFYLLHQANTCLALPEIGFFYRINQEGQITAGGGASRLDLIPIFEQLLEVAEKNNFDNIEKAYILRLMVDFSIWSIEVTNIQFLHALLNGLHTIFERFTKAEVDFYLDTCSESRVKEGGLISCLAGKNYLDLEDYETRDAVIEKNYQKSPDTKVRINQKNGLLKGGIQCVSEHGISYTAIWMIRKYIFKKH